MTDPKLTPAECDVLAHLVAAWNGYVALPDRDDLDDVDFQNGIHAAQSAMAMRVARRADPDVWAGGQAAGSVVGES